MSTILLIAMIAAILFFFILPGLKTRVFRVKKLLIMPAVFIYLNYDSIQRHFHIHASDYALLITALILGILIGAYCRKTAKIRADQQKKLIEVAGSYFGLSMFIAIFAVHFVIGYIDSVHPGYLLQPSQYQEILMFLLTATSALSIGANSVLYYRYRTASHCDLQDK